MLSEEALNSDGGSKQVGEAAVNDSKSSGSTDASKGSQATRRDFSMPWGSMLVVCLSITLGLLTTQTSLFEEAQLVINRLVKVSLGRHGDAPAAAAAILQPDPCPEERLMEFLHEKAVPGFHIICLKPSLDMKDSPIITATFYKYGLKSKKKRVKLPYSHDWETLKQSFVKNLGLRGSAASRWHPEKQPWAVFSTEGQRLVSEHSKETVPGQYPDSLINKHGMILLYEGGQFMWPGVRIGFKRIADLNSVMLEGSPDMSSKHRTVTLETLSLEPLILSVTGFLSDDECKHVQEQAEPHLQYSSVLFTDHHAGRPASDFRTSQQTFLPPIDATLVDIDYRTASLVRVPRIHQESVQVLRYEIGQKYDAHFDYFDPSSYQNDPNTLNMLQHGRRNRMATVFWYLTDVAQGGETVFPRFNGGQERDYTDCETGLKVKPEAGKVIIFYNLRADGQMDPNSLHGACPVKEGVKWAANKWVWNEPMSYVPP